MQAGGFFTNVQLSYQHFFNKTALQGYYFGFKIGYKYCPSNWKMSVNNQTLTNAPKINMDGLIATLYFGGGSISKSIKNN